MKNRKFKNEASVRKSWMLRKRKERLQRYRNGERWIKFNGKWRLMKPPAE